jgi:hypothetical protein
VLSHVGITSINYRLEPWSARWCMRAFA